MKVKYDEKGDILYIDLFTNCSYAEEVAEGVYKTIDIKSNKVSGATIFDFNEKDFDELEKLIPEINWDEVALIEMARRNSELQEKEWYNMNLDTKELRLFKSTEEALAEGFNPLPNELVNEAVNELIKNKPNEKVIVADGPLYLWAEGLRQGRNNKCNCGSGKKYKNCCLKRSGE